MPQQTEHFLCPTCGMHAPIERLYQEEPFVFKMFRKILGGKRRISDAEKELQKGEGLRHGSAPGVLQYDPIEITDEVRNQLHVRLEENLEAMD